MPMRAMLPPNLTRHYYETRRLVAEGAGKEMTPWYRLTEGEKAAVELEVEMFRRSILRAEEEQDVVASYNAAAAAEPVPAADPTTAENCSCFGCSVVAAFLELLKQAQRLEESMRPRVKTPNSFPFNISEISTVGPARTPTPEEAARVRQFAQDVVDEWVAAGKPLEVVADPTVPGNVIWQLELTPSHLTRSDVDAREALRDREQRRFEAQSLKYFTRRAPFPPKV